MDAHSEARLAGVHPDLCRVIRAASQNVQPFVVVQGLRSVADEAKAVATGHSTTMHSRHLPNKQGLACAVDLMAMIAGKGSFAPGREAEVFGRIAEAVKAAAHAEAVPIEWGGDWHSFKDWGHFQLPWAAYP